MDSWFVFTRVIAFWSCNIIFPVDCAISQGQNSPSASLVINSIVMRLWKRVSPTWAPTTWKSWTSRRNLSRSSPRSMMHFWPPSLLSSKFPGSWDPVLTKLANSLLCLLTETTLMKRSKICRVPSNSRWRRYKQLKHLKKSSVAFKGTAQTSDHYWCTSCLRRITPFLDEEIVSYIWKSCSRPSNLIVKHEQELYRYQ